MDDSDEKVCVCCDMTLSPNDPGFESGGETFCRDCCDPYGADEDWMMDSPGSRRRHAGYWK
jgi:hypothetical protein